MAYARASPNSRKWKACTSRYCSPALFSQRNILSIWHHGAIEIGFIIIIIIILNTLGSKDPEG